MLLFSHWAVSVHQDPLFMEFPKQEYWSELPFPPPGIFPIQGSNPCFLCLLHWQTTSLPLSHQRTLALKCYSRSWPEDQDMRRKAKLRVSRKGSFRCAVIVAEAVVIIVNNVDKEIGFLGILTGSRWETGGQFCVTCLLHRIIYQLLFFKITLRWCSIVSILVFRERLYLFPRWKFGPRAWGHS